MLDFVNATSKNCEQPQWVALAIWLHDVMYIPQNSNNEEQSALFAEQQLTTLGLKPNDIVYVTQLILSTKQHQHSNNHDTQLLSDIDLAILGAQPQRFKCKN